MTQLAETVYPVLYKKQEANTFNILKTRKDSRHKERGNTDHSN